MMGFQAGLVSIILARVSRQVFVTGIPMNCNSTCWSNGLPSDY